MTGVRKRSLIHRIYAVHYTLDLTVTTSGNNCPKCGTRVAPPFGAIFLGPFWPFGYWQCQNCFSPLRFRLLPYYVVNFIALFPGIAFLLLLDVLGYEDTPWAFLAIPVFWAAFYWLAVRIAAVEVEQ